MGKTFTSGERGTWTRVPDVLAYVYGQESHMPPSGGYVRGPGHRSLLFYRVYAPPATKSNWDSDADPLVMALNTAHDEEHFSSSQRSILQHMARHGKEVVDALNQPKSEPRRRLGVRRHSAKSHRTSHRLNRPEYKVPPDLFDMIGEYLARGKLDNK